MEINSDLQSGIITLSDQFQLSGPTYSLAPSFGSTGSEYIQSFINLSDVISFDSFSYDSLGETENRYLKTYYRVSRDQKYWTEWLDLSSSIINFPPVNSKDKLFLDVKWVREGDNSMGLIYLLEYNLEGTLDNNIIDNGDVINVTSGESAVIQPPYIYKIFNIRDIEIISPNDISGVDISYRYSQDSSKTWSSWEPFTKQNITTKRINPIRFFQIQYSVNNNTDKNISIQDINLIGDFQNVSNDYFKTNLFGIRECCQSNLITNPDLNQGVANCDTTSMMNSLKPMTDDQKSKLYNPYAQSAAIGLLNVLSYGAQEVFGFPVKYFITDPDKKGQDFTLNENQLYNISCEGDIKISVAGNNFPDSQIVMNQFDLGLFESMEVHITKQQFKEVFGPEKRPGKEDIIFFCDINRMFIVDHAQQFRNFNNAAVYYKLMLKKYNTKSNVQAGNAEVKNKLNQLTKNSTIDELFGVEQVQDKATANLDQYQTLSRDPIRLDIAAEIVKELIENSSNIISKSNYDLSSVMTSQSPGVVYKNLDPVLNVSDNIGYMLWFNINNYIVGENYNFFNYYDNVNNLGWQINLKNDIITLNMNSATYSYNITGATISNAVAFQENTWYCYVANIDQRNGQFEQFVYKRNVSIESDAGNLNSTLLKQVYYNTMSYTASNYELVYTYPDMNSVNGQILSSDMKVTNIRLFVDVIPQSYHQKLLNQNIINQDTKYLVFADNANSRIYLPNYPIGNES